MKTITRRHFLRANGVAVALPMMQSLGSAKTPNVKLVDSTSREEPDDGVPAKKLVMMYVPNGVVRRCFFPGEEQEALPSFIGGFEADKVKDERRIQNQPGVYPLVLTETLRPLEANISDVTLITGLDRSYKHGQDVHAQGASCYLTSVSPGQAAEHGMRHPNGRSLDQVIGDAVGHRSILKTLEISCNGFTAGKESIFFDNISWYGPGRIAPSIRDPQKLYRRLFVADDYRAHMADVTDLILADAKTLNGRLGREDRKTFSEFLAMIRDIEIRIEKMGRLVSEVDIEIPRNEVVPRGEYIRLQADMMLLAMQMGITNISTFMIGPERWDATLMYEGVFDEPVQHHNLTHNQQGEGYKQVQKIDQFHIEQFRYVLNRMKELKDSDGSSLLENSILTYGAGLGDGATHQYFDLPMIVAGKAQGQIKQSRFIKCRSGTLNSNLWLTIAQLMGLEIEQFADSTGVISDLWT